MAKTAKTKGDVDDPSDKEPKVWLDDDVGPAWKAQREKIDLSQRELASKVGVSPGTVSNVETGAQRTLRRPIYMRWRRVLFKDTAGIPEDIFVELANELADTDALEAQQLIEIAKTIKKRRTRP